MIVELWIPGRPAPKGSKRALGRRNNGSVILIEQSIKLPAWKEACDAAVDEWLYSNPGYVPLNGPIGMRIEFWLPRPKRPRFQDYPAVAPDLSKLIRATEDQLQPLPGGQQSRIISDDARIVSIEAHKQWATHETGANVQLWHI